MQNIADLLRRYRNIRPPDAAVKKIVIEVVQKSLGIELHRISVSVIRGVVYIDVNPTIKSELFIHKEKILQEVQKEVGVENIKEIR
jgi:hypothetical protein